MSFTVYLRNAGTLEWQRKLLASGCAYFAQLEDELVCRMPGAGPYEHSTTLAHMVRGKWCPVDDPGFLWDGFEVVSEPVACGGCGGGE